MSARVTAALRDGCDVAWDVPRSDVIDDDDVQLALWLLYEQHYRGFDDVEPEREWDPELVRLRVVLEAALERDVRRLTVDRVAAVVGIDDVADQLFAMAELDAGPSVAAFLQRQARLDQVLEFLRIRSVYHLKESDPQAFVLARIDGAAKVALAELLYDEFGGGRPAMLHSRMYSDGMEACGLDGRYGAYLDEASALTLAVNNVMSMFAVNRRWRGASMGHLAMFEVTSSVPCRKIAAGIERVGLPDAMARYFHEHVEADAVHEQVAARNICGSLVAQEPGLRDDVLLGAAACAALDELAGRELLDLWQDEQVA